MEDMLFSILIPAYKNKYLKDCIDSVFSQTYKNWELIIINDASPEDLDSIVSHYSDKRLKYYKNKENCGALNVVDNWNKCLSHAVGVFVICIGDDDRFLPNCLEEYHRLIEKFPECNVYHGWTQIIDESGNVLEMQESRPVWEGEWSMVWHRWNNNRVQYIGDFAYRTQTLKENGGFYKLPLAWASDDISALIAARKYGVANTQVPVFQYRKSLITISRTSHYNDKIDASLNEYKWYKLEIKRKERISKIEEIFKRNVENILTGHFHTKVYNYIFEDIFTGKTVSRWLYWYKRRTYTGINRRYMVRVLFKVLFNKITD